VAVPRPTSGLFRSISVAGAVALGVGLTATSGQAVPGPSTPPTPTTSAQAMAQLRTFNEQFEKVTEQYNIARIMLERRKADSRTATARADAAQQALTGYHNRVKRLVHSESRSGPFETFGAMLSSRSPGEFAAQASLIDVVASRRSAVLDAAARASTVAAKAKSDADAATAAADKLARELAARRADLSRRAAQSQALYDKLSAAERRAFLAAQPHTVDRASRADTRPAPSPSATASTPAPAPASAPASVPVSGRASVAVATARAQLGKPYVWAASGPDAFDCSGLTMFSWAAAGVSLPHSAAMQYNSAPHVSRSQLQPGDLVFFGSPAYHVGIYVGGGMMIHAPQTGDVVKYASIGILDYSGAARPG
jgi:peptidoglycan DL-endopeptidase CwlO